jgi:hypothetical protein
MPTRVWWVARGPAASYRRPARFSSPELWGWRRNPTGPALVPQGSRIGWVIGNDLFLDPISSYRVAEALACVERLTVSKQSLHHRLRENGLLASIDHGRQMVQVRRTLEGFARQVLHLKATDLAGDFQSAGRRQPQLRT